MPRWDLLQQVAMSDRYSILGSFYPDAGLGLKTAASPYFPGVALLSLLVKAVVPDSLLIYSLHFIAGIVVISFFMIQKRITASIYKEVSLKNFYIGIIFFTLIFCRQFLLYALEFKPDIIAFLLGSAGIILAKADNKNKIKLLPYFFGAVLTGGALIFKQQYIAFLIGMFIYSFVCKNPKFQIFTVLSLTFSLLTLYFLLKQDNLLFWTVTNLSDDGFYTFKQWVLGHAGLIIHLAQAMVLLFGAHFFGFHKIDLTNNLIPIRNLVRNFISTPWPTLILFSALAALVSSTKTGGNNGNTELGLILIFPIIYFLIHNFNKRILTLFVWVSFLAIVPYLYVSILSFQNSVQLNNAAELLVTHIDNKVLSGSDVYGAARIINTQKPIDDLWAIEEVNNGENILSNILSSQSYDVIIIENHPYNREPIMESIFYSVEFENGLGIIAKKYK